MKTVTTRARSRAIRAAAILGLSLVTLRCFAIEPAEASLLAGPCANCHGTDGRSPGAIPSLAGRPDSLLKLQLSAYRSDTPPPGTTIMNRLAKGYTEAELDALAIYFSRIPADAPATATESVK